MENTLQRLSNLGLPKWPQMVVWGSPVTEDQAKDILFRTDTFFANMLEEWTTTRPWAIWARTLLGAEQVNAALAFPDLTEASTMEDRVYAAALREARHTVQQAFRDQYHLVRTKYVRNNFACSNFVYGPHGWCHPDGRIHGFDNVGSDPCAERIYQDWVTIAEAFPFLELKATLMNAEQGETESWRGIPKEPVVTFTVQNGTVGVSFEPELPEGISQRDLAAALTVPTSDIGTRTAAARKGAVPDSWIANKADEMRAFLLAKLREALKNVPAGPSTLNREACSE